MALRPRRRVLASLAAAAACFLLTAAARPARAEVMLHAFGWSYATVERRAAAIAAAGYRSVLVAPPLQTGRGGGWGGSGSAWWPTWW